ncbi:MAG: N-formylglutamate deformylase [Pseudomonadota bacterium]|nr:N-formylglutamate deformylase [Pseudomonadota bacterium]
MADWLTIRRGAAPLVVSLPHTGTEIPEDCQTGLVSLWLARRDADWWIDTLYDFAAEMDATVVHTAISRTVIDVNRDPSGVSLYPGQATTELCPTTTFDGDPLYKPGREPDETEIERRKARYHTPYYEALQDEIARLRASHPAVAVYDCHSIRSRIPRLFEGDLPVFNIGTDSGRSCAPALQAQIEAITGASGFSSVSNGRFKGGYITRSLGDPTAGIHAVQMELACRAYMAEPEVTPTPDNWPTPYDAVYAEPLREHLKTILATCLRFVEA